MKRTLLLGISILVIITSCQKSTVLPATPVAGNASAVNSTNTGVTTVTINGTDYPYVQIGTQLWTTVNYNGAGGVNYNDGANVPAYGKLYTFAEATAIPLPTGWRLPTQADFLKLMNTVGTSLITGTPYITGLDTIEGAKLRSVNDWISFPGNNQSGFNALPTGEYIEYIGGYTTNPFSNKGYETIFWSSTPGPGTSYPPYCFYFQNIKLITGVTIIETIIGPLNVIYTFKLCVRFVKDN